MPGESVFAQVMKFIKAFVSLALLLLSHSLYAQGMSICYEDAENVPWNIAGGQGLNNRLVKLAAAQSGVAVDLQALPWKRCLADVAAGRVAGVLGASYTDERAAYAVYPTTASGELDATRRIRFDGYSFYRLKGSAPTWDGKSFSKLAGPIGVQLGYAIASDLKKMGVPVDESAGDARAHMAKLAQGQQSLIALLTYEGNALLMEPEFAGVVEAVQPAFSQKPYFVIFNKAYYHDNQKTVEALWAAMAVVRESPAFKQLVRDKLKK
jgi:polar amino acid transport system substrate-binding protein